MYHIVHRNRDRIRLVDNPAEFSDDQQEVEDEEVLGLNLSSDEEDDDQQDDEMDMDDARDVINKMPGLRKHLKDREIDMVEGAFHKYLI